MFQAPQVSCGGGLRYGSASHLFILILLYFYSFVYFTIIIVIVIIFVVIIIIIIIIIIIFTIIVIIIVFFGVGGWVTFNNIFAHTVAMLWAHLLYQQNIMVYNASYRRQQSIEKQTSYTMWALKSYPVVLSKFYHTL